MRLPNLLATHRGRLAAFFLLYVTEGIPLGFAATAVATQLRRQDVGPAEIGAFVGSFYLPWAFKWAFGPFIDVFASERLGRRRGWIIVTQVLMATTLMSTVLLDLPAQLALFTLILLVHNTFGAMQDVAIDALACNTLAEDERGLANGLMFAGASIGQAVGGSGVLFVSAYTGFQPTLLLRCRRHPGGDAVRRAADARGGDRAARRRSAASRACARRGARCASSPSNRSGPSSARAAPSSAWHSRCCRRARCAWAWHCSPTWRWSSA